MMLNKIDTIFILYYDIVFINIIPHHIISCHLLLPFPVTPHIISHHLMSSYHIISSHHRHPITSGHHPVPVPIRAPLCPQGSDSGVGPIRSIRCPHTSSSWSETHHTRERCSTVQFECVVLFCPVYAIRSIYLSPTLLLYYLSTYIHTHVFYHASSL